MSKRTGNIQSLADYRKQSGYKMKDIAKEMGVSVRYLRAWETGERPISLPHFVKLMALYGQDPHTSDILAIIPERTNKPTNERTGSAEKE